MTAAGEPLTLAHGDELRPLLAAVRQSAAPPPGTLSDATFANLLLFRDAHDWRLLRGRWPCISGHAYDGARLLLPLFDLAAAPVDELRALLQGHDAFGPLDDAQLARLDPALFVASSSRGDADYLYSAEQFRHYRGTLLQKKANLVRQLLARHRVDAEPYAPALADEAAQVLQGWLHDKAKQPGDTDDGPCLQALQRCSALGLHGQVPGQGCLARSALLRCQCEYAQNQFPLNCGNSNSTCREGSQNVPNLGLTWRRRAGGSPCPGA